MIKKKKIFFSLILFIFSFYINFNSANVGILPIDSFAFFDTGYLVSKGFHPIKDFWVTTGVLVDYIQAIFFNFFGVSWFTYTLHASTLNFLLSIFFFIFFYNNKLSINLSFFYSLAISILFYPTIGTPFAYHHALLFSILSVMILYLIIKYNYKIFWTLLPFSMLFSFLCMQSPSAFINLLIIIYLIFHFFKKKDYKNYKYFLLSSLTCLLLLTIYFYFTEVPISNFIYQYILFPLSISADRIAGSEGAFVKLNSKFTFKSIIGDFKFIHSILIIYIYTSLRNSNFLTENNYKLNFEIFIIIIFFSFIIIFSQLVTANQIYIFCLIPILAGLTHMNIVENTKKNNLIKILLILIVFISSFKYFERYNLDRKFIDLENYSLKNSFNASQLSPKFKNLDWISMHYAEDPKKEFENLKLVMKKINEDKREKMIISHYQFFSATLNDNFNNLNRWYTNDNNSYPLAGHKYFHVYKDFINSKIKKSKVEVIYIVDSTGKGQLKISNFEQYLNDICFFNQTIVKDYFSSHTLKNCK